jgi:hypothetical protein
MTHVTSSGDIKYETTFPSTPFSKRHGWNSSGSRSDGVPENPMRVSKSMLPPKACPLDVIFMPWYFIVSGKTVLKR